jgi:D-alanine transaminase
LLPNVLAKQEALKAGAYEAWFVDEDGFVTEGSSTNAWIVVDGQEVVTRPLGPQILAGITRHSVIEAARQANIRVTERAFTLEEALTAREAFITSTTSFVLPVVSIDGKAVGEGRPGPVARALLDAYRGLISDS